ncbi:MAG: hypothetical protein RLZZ71_1451 [Bacteroidota bacterium]|jgi:hypothetical protein
MKKLLFTWSAVCLSLLTTAQERWQVHGNIQYGFVVPHNSLMEPLITDHSVGGSVRFVKRITNRLYSRPYGKPYQGVDFTFINTGNNTQLGKQFALSFWNQFPINRKLFGAPTLDKKFLHLGIGMGYTTKIWDLQTNYQAPVLGSHMNAALSIGFEQQVFSTQTLQCKLGIRVTHFSNGAFQLPNLGTNTLALTFGIQPLTKPKAPKKDEEHEILLLRLLSKYNYSLSYSQGWKEVMQPYGKKYPIYLLSAGWDFRTSRVKHCFGLTADVMFNSSLIPLMENRDGMHPNNRSVFQLGAGPTFCQNFGNTQLRIVQGIYLRDKWAETTPVYQRVILRHAPMDKRWFIQFGLKTHFAKADYGEIGFGYRL